jgi:hypothetical protein
MKLGICSINRKEVKNGFNIYDFKSSGEWKGDDKAFKAITSLAGIHKNHRPLYQ